MLILGNGVSWLIILPACGLAGALLFLAYRRVVTIRDYGAWMPRAMLGLRLGAVALCLLLIVNPVFRVNQTPRDSQRIAVLVDTSRSMGIHDSLGGAARIETARRILESQELLPRLADLAQVQLAAFDTALRPAEIKQLAAAGDGTLLNGALDGTRNAREKVPLSAIVLLTDGCETGAKSAADLSPGVPIYCVGLGSVNEALAQLPDIALASVKADREAFIHTKVEVRVALRQANLTGEPATVQIRRGETILAEERLTLATDAVSVALAFTPEQTGLYDLEARVLPHPKEKITENNSRYFAVRVTDRKIRVFYYDGTPRWEYKFITRELKRDAQVALQAVLRTNPDRIYQSSAAADSRAVLFPATREALKGYDCIILGDLRQQDLLKAQAEALKAYVSEDGGGLIVLGGKESFSPGGLSALGLEPLLPVGLAGVRELTGALNVALTPEGAAHPALAGLSHFLPLENIYAVGLPKPGAEVLLKAEAEGAAYPLAVAQRYGTGRVFLFAADSDWKWVMKYRANDGDTLFVKFWGQAIRWAANREMTEEKQAPLTVTTDKDIYQPEEFVRIFVQGADLTGVTEAALGDDKVPLQKTPDRLEGRYQPRRSGLHHVTVAGAGCEFIVERPAGELDRIALNDMLLRQIAASSGGQYFDALSAQNLPDALRSSGNIKADVREYVLAESWLPFLVILLALGAEWALRKRMQVI